MYMNQNRRRIKYSRFQILSLSLNMSWIKWRKVRVLLYVKVLHSPIIIFYWSFYSKKLLNLYFTTAIKLYLDIFFRLIFDTSEDFVKVSWTILRHQIEFIPCFILMQKPSTNFLLHIRNFFYLAISSLIFLWSVSYIYKLCVQGETIISILKFWCNPTQKTSTVKTKNKSKLNVMDKNLAPKTNLLSATLVVLLFLSRLIKIKCFRQSTEL